MISGIVMILVGICYFIAAKLFGGVPRPILQRTEDLPLNTELRFVDSSDSMASGIGAGARSSPQGFRI